MSRRYIKSWRTEMNEGKKTPRICLKCGKTFYSIQPKSQHRICNRCKKATNYWNISSQHNQLADNYMPNYRLAMGQAVYFDS